MVTEKPTLSTCSSSIAAGILSSRILIRAAAAVSGTVPTPLDALGKCPRHGGELRGGPAAGPSQGLGVQAPARGTRR